MDKHTWTRLGLLGVGLGVLAAPSLAIGQEEAMQPQAPKINNGNVTFNVYSNIVTQYWFRGIAQENQGFILQPGANVNFKLFQQGDISVDGYAGVWNSLDYSSHGSSVNGDLVGNDNALYETDFSIGTSVSLPHGLGLDISYLSRLNPNGGGEFDEEFDIFASYDDTELMKNIGLDNVTLAPHAGIVQEVDGGADRGNKKGTYLELGLEPSFTVVQSEDYPVTISVPVTAGFNLHNYYEATDGSDSGFGYLDIGVDASTPLTFIPVEYGQWTAHAGIHGIFLGDSARQISHDNGSGGNGANVYGTFGLSMDY